MEKQQRKGSNRGPVYKWWLSLDKEERERVALGANTSVAYIWQIAWKFRRAGSDKARLIHEASKRLTSGKEISLAELRPDLWGED